MSTFNSLEVGALINPEVPDTSLRRIMDQGVRGEDNNHEAYYIEQHFEGARIVRTDVQFPVIAKTMLSVIPPE
jgi:hypothetical protein